MTREEAKYWLEIELKTWENECKSKHHIKEALSVVIKALEQEPKTGQWITKIKSDLRGDMWPTNPKCSECGGEPYYHNTIYNYKFCPYCGAKMAESEE